MSNKRNEPDPLNKSDQVIYDYLNEMLSDPSSESPDVLLPKKTKKQRVIDQSAFPKEPQPEKPVVCAKASPRLLAASSLLSLKAFQDASDELATIPIATTHLKQTDPLVKPKSTKTREPLKDKPVEKGESAHKKRIETEIPSSKQPPAPEIKPAVEVKACTPVKNEPVEAIVEEEAEEWLKKLPPTDVWLENGRPKWAEERFESLIFKVAGLKLAVPLLTLGSVHKIDRTFNQLPGQNTWCVGILRTSTGNIKVIDTACCVMPERYDVKKREGLQYIISIHGYEWGLACHEICNSIKLEPSDVKWRTERGKRPWLAGTVVSQMCSLLDTSGFQSLIVGRQ